MSFCSQNPQLDPIVHDVILAKAKRMVGRDGIESSEIDDVAQYLCAKLLERFPLGPEDSPRGALLEITIGHLLSNYARDCRARKRKPPAICSLSVIVDLDEDGRPIDLAATISAKEQEKRLGIKTRSDQAIVELRLDVASVIARLAPDEAGLCERLKYDTPAQVARDLGVPPSTVNDRIRRLMAPFADAGLSKFI